MIAIGSFSYVVRCSFTVAEERDAFLGWLRDTHVADVCRAGALGAELVVLDRTGGEPYVLEVRYRFASREAFERYERDHAPRLRAEGVAAARRLGLEPGVGVVMTRTTGKLIRQ